MIEKRPLASIVLVLGAGFAPAAAVDSGQWPSFRGPGASGLGAGDTPTRWNLETSENVLWKREIPGLGLSSPVIWGERLFITTAVHEKGEARLKVGLYGDIQPVADEGAHAWWVYCLDTGSGDVRWRYKAHEGLPRVKRHPKSSHANSTAATDGKHVVAFFGSEGLYCLDVDGAFLWKKDLGLLDAGFFRFPAAQWGFGSSPVLHGEAVIVQCDVQKDSFLAAFRLRDGEQIWRTPRQEVPTWGTPTVHVGAESTQVIVNGFKHIGGYDVASGKEIWRMTGGGDIPVPTPVLAHGLAFITNAHGGPSPLYAIRLTASGDISLR